MRQKTQQIAVGAFDEFWQHYPRRVGKLAAIKAYAKARKYASAEAILAGLQRARFADDQQFIPHPATWLNGGRWLDEDATAPAASAESTEDWYDECRRMHGGACGLSQHAHHTRKIIDAGKGARLL